MEPVRTVLPEFQGQFNVTEIKDERGTNYLTQSVSFCDEVFGKNATKLNTVHNEKKHVLFLFNSASAEVGRYYLCRNVQSLSKEELAAKKHMLVVFKSWNPLKKEWVPCVSITEQENLAQSAVSI